MKDEASIKKQLLNLKQITRFSWILICGIGRIAIKAFLDCDITIGPSSLKFFADSFGNKY